MAPRFGRAKIPEIGLAAPSRVMHVERKMKTRQKKFFMNQEASSHWRRLQSRFFLVLSLSAALCAPYGSKAQTPPSGPPQPKLIQPDWTNDQFSFTLQSQTGLLFEILASKNLAQPDMNWTSLVTFTNTTGTFSFTDTATTLNQRFYRAHELSYPRRPVGVYARIVPSDIIKHDQGANWTNYFNCFYAQLLANPAISGLCLSIHWGLINTSAEIGR